MGAPNFAIGLHAGMITDELIERGVAALINADAQEPYDRPPGDHRPEAIVRAVLRAAIDGVPYRDQR